MADTIQCPGCSSRLALPDPALLAKTLACPSCQKVFRMNVSVERATAAIGTAEPAGGLDFSDLGSLDPLAMPLPSMNQASSGSAWSAPVRQVPTEPGKAVVKSTGELQEPSRLWIILGGVAGALLLVAVSVFAVRAMFASGSSANMQANAAPTIDLTPIPPGPQTDPSPTIRNTFNTLFEEAVKAYGPNGLSIYSKTVEGLSPVFFETTSEEEELLSQGKPMRDVAKTRALLDKAFEMLPSRPKPNVPYDTNNAVHNEIRLRMDASALRAGAAELNSLSKENWQAFDAVEVEMYGSEALTRQATVTEIVTLKKLSSKLIDWSKELGIR